MFDLNNSVDLFDRRVADWLVYQQFIKIVAVSKNTRALSNSTDACSNIDTRKRKHAQKGHTRSRSSVVDAVGLAQLGGVWSRCKHTNTTTASTTTSAMCGGTGHMILSNELCSKKTSTEFRWPSVCANSHKKTFNVGGSLRFKQLNITECPKQYAGACRNVRCSVFGAMVMAMHTPRPTVT